MRLKNVPFKKSLKDELRNKSGPKKAKDFKDLHLKNPKDTSVNETKEIILNLRRIWGEVPAEKPKISKEKITKKSK